MPGAQKHPEADVGRWLCVANFAVEAHGLRLYQLGADGRATPPLPGAYSALKETLGAATAGVKAISIVPANGNPQPDGRSTRSKVLAQVLKDAGRTVSVAPAAANHGAAAAVLNGTAAPIGTRDRFDG